MRRENILQRCTPVIVVVRIITGLLNVWGHGFYYYSTTTRAPELYVSTDSGLQPCEFDDPRRCRWRWMPTVATVWACKAVPLKTAGKHPAKSMETERGASVGAGTRSCGKRIFADHAQGQTVTSGQRGRFLLLSWIS